MEVVDTILEVFEFHNRFHRRRTPTVMNRDELARHQEPNWLQIRRAIQESAAVLLIITQGITQRMHTQNWVAFEVGIAAGHNPPVYNIITEHGKQLLQNHQLLY